MIECQRAVRANRPIWWRLSVESCYILCAPVNVAERGSLVDGQRVQLLDDLVLVTVGDLDPPDGDIGVSIFWKNGTSAE
jgi:hypothetical protein